MTYGIEARVPFLDHRLVEFALGIPAEQKIQRRGRQARHAPCRRWRPAARSRLPQGQARLPDALRRLVAQATCAPKSTPFSKMSSSSATGTMPPRCARIWQRHQAGAINADRLIHNLITTELVVRPFRSYELRSPPSMKKMILLLSAILPSFLRVPLLRALGFKLGANVRLGWLSFIVVRDIEIGDRTHIGSFCYVRARQLTLGKRVQIGSLSLISTGQLHLGDDTRISRFVIVTAGQFNPQSRLITGKRVAIFPFCWIDTTREVFMDDDAGIGGGTYIFTHGSWQPIIDGFPVAFGAVRIERNVWLPWRIFILPGVTLGAHSTIGAGAVINKSVPPYSLAGGVPAKVIRADGEHIRRYTVEEKIALVREILDNAVEKLGDHGYTVVVNKQDSAVTLTADGRTIVFQTRVAALPTPAPAVLLTWERFPDALLAGLDAQGVGWFDIERRRCADLTDPLFQTIKSVFSIYGTRFEPTSSRSAVTLPDVERATVA